jgi:hypothetical protein
MVLYNTPEERRMNALRYGSPLFNLKNSALVSGSQDIADFESIPKAQKYLPFNFLQVTNNGEDEITIYFDCDATQAKVIPKGTIMTFENIWYRRILYKNTGSASISANKIEFVGQLLPVKEEYAKPQIPIIQRIKLFLGVE